LVEVLDITASPLVPLKEVGRTAEPIARASVLQGGAPVVSRPLLWPGVPMVETVHNGAWTAPDVEVHVVRDAVVGGPGAHIRRGAAYVWASGAGPNYLRHWMAEGLSDEWWAFEPGRPVPADRVWAVLHFNLIYGHWLIEMMPKLFLIARLRAHGITAPIAWPTTAPEYMRAIVEAVLPGQPLLEYDPRWEHIAAERVLMPGMMHREYVFHPALADDLNAFAVTCGAPHRPGASLFVSRSALGRPSTFRDMTNAQEVEALAAGLGLEVVHPEQLTWRDQVALFAGARLVVGEFGSGLHNALFSPAGTRVVALNWITEVQSRIATFRGHDLGYVMDPDGRPRAFRLEPGMQPFHIDLRELRDRLEPLLDKPPAAPAPGAWAQA
jgi:O-antigen biosynthesis protein WbqL